MDNLNNHLAKRLAQCENIMINIQIMIENNSLDTGDVYKQLSEYFDAIYGENRRNRIVSISEDIPENE